MRSRPSLPWLALLLSSVLLAAPAGPRHAPALVRSALAADAPTRILGFRATDVEAERAREAQVAAAIRPDTLRRHLRILTEQPHVAGTPNDLKTAEYVRDQWCRPAPLGLESICGVRPCSLMQTTSVSSNRPRCSRSRINAE